MEEVKNDARWRDILEVGEGYVFNDFSGGGPSGKQYNVVHRATCSYLRSANLSVPKYSFATLDEAAAWLDANRPNNWKCCKTCIDARCEAEVALVSPAASQAGHDIGPFKEALAQEILVDHLQAQGYGVRESYRVPSGIVDVVAQSDSERLIIEVKGEDRGGYTSAQMNFQMGVGQLLSRMTEREATYAIAFPFTADFQRVLATYEKTFGLAKAEITAFVIHDDRSVLRLSPPEFLNYIDHGCLPSSRRASIAE